MTYEETYAHTPEMVIMPQPEYKWKVTPLPDIEIRMEDDKRPCLWIRLWMRLFFGWKFEEIDE